MVIASETQSLRDDLIAEIPAAIRAYLRRIAKSEFHRRMWQFLFMAFLILNSAMRALSGFVDPQFFILGIVGLAAIATFSFGYLLRWPDRREQRLLRQEVDYRREHGKWRWEL